LITTVFWGSEILKGAVISERLILRYLTGKGFYNWFTMG